MFVGQPDEPGLPPEALRELNALLSQLCDEVIELDDLIRLGDLLEAEPAARRHYLKYIALHSSLAASTGGLQSGGGEHDAAPLLAIFDGDYPAALEDHTAAGPASNLAPPSRRPLFVAAAILFIALGAVVWSFYSPRAAKQQPATQHAVASSKALRHSRAGHLVAEITYASPAIRWHPSNELYALTSRVRAGQSLALALGSVELTYESGTTLRLTGPSEFTVDENGGMLERGEIVAHVTEKGHGFTIHTPHGKIIDRGTDFGVVVDDFGVSEVNVFQGRVEAFPIVGSGPPAPKIDLTTGRMLQWSGESIISVNAAHRTRPGNLANPDALQLTPTVLLNLPAGSEALAPHRWKTLGVARLVPGGLRLDGGANPTERPYLLTVDEYDPSEGPLTIACDVQFDEVDVQSQPAFSILTRGADDRSRPNTPWHDVLANCVRCSLKSGPSSGEGMLEAGAKYEFDREPSTISWRGFARPRAGVTYHLQMRDDGLNVSFTVSESGNESVSKTVTCRSLFRGIRNFIAFEGFAGGAATVSNLRITQVRNRMANEGQRQHKNRPAANQAVGQSLAAEKVFAELIPRRAELRVAESFDAENLDDDRWMSLGDAIVEGGQLRLGLANPEQHIDTWRQRPYLLTRERFNSAESALTIMGRASFASNFLHGYGGSFAVLTRAEADYGTGPGWEQSALRRGLRANFWPAALGQNRSLELFEMLSPEPLNLLATADFPIDPRSRTYFFCIQDDGGRAQLTLVDAENPNLRKTLAHATESMLLSTGHIAFEGCWGAPVMLDDVRIYQGANIVTPQTLQDD
jgi:hypothetical protein